MKGLASIGSWPWWTVALVGVAWLSLYGFWMWRQVESTAVSLAEICSSLRSRRDLFVFAHWMQSHCRARLVSVCVMGGAASRSPRRPVAYGSAHCTGCLTSA